MIKIKTTMIVGRYNLVNTSYKEGSDDHYIFQLSKEEVRQLRDSANDALEKEGEQNDWFKHSRDEECY